ncbi:MAG: hypothetical protein K0A94_10345 [Desulfuromonadales bacterium]|nr:hypothetical protein [Desulfuromonadales bacterium]
MGVVVNARFGGSVVCVIPRLINDVRGRFSSSMATNTLVTGPPTLRKGIAE